MNYNLQFIQGVAGDEFYISMQCGIQADDHESGLKNGGNEQPHNSAEHRTLATED